MKCRKSLLTILLTVLLAMFGMTVSAEELTSTEIEESVSMESETENAVWEEAEEDIEVTDGIIASGKNRNITWVIDGSGKLTVEGTGDLFGDRTSSNFAWMPYRSKITSAVINVSGMTNASNLFWCCSNMESVDLSGFDTKNVTNMAGMFSECSNLINVDMSGFDTRNVTDMGYMFSGCSSLTSVDISGFDTGNVTSMIWMFSGCSSLTSVDVKSFDTSKVTNMNGMFSGCSRLTSVDVSGFDTGNVTSMFWMFCNCSSLTSLDVGGFDTSNTMSMEGMFLGCSGLTSLDVSSFDNSSVTNMCEMFSGCSGLTSVDMRGFGTSNVTDMTDMFSECSNLISLDLRDFDTSNVTLMGWMFSGCSSLKSVDVSSFDTSNVEYMERMFSDCNSLASLDVSSFDVGNVTDAEYMRNMFSGCRSLTMLYSPYNVSVTVPLPSGSGTIWHLSDGTTVTNLPQNLDYSVILTRTDGSISPSPTPVNPPSGETIQKVQNFVSRMYTVALGRSAEETGLNDWTNRLLTHEIDGAGIANGFIMSDEFKNRNLSNEDFVDTLYRTFFDREADQGGRATWLAELTAGKSRSYVLAGFVNSTEFDNLCDAYGIARGTMREDGSPVNAGIRQFVERCYTKVLGREGEKAGVEDWTNRIATGTMSAEDVAKSFFFSDEYTYKNTDNETFVETLYQTFMDRASDPAGKSDWVGRLGAGTGREEVLEGFSRSEEFAGILRSYGL